MAVRAWCSGMVKNPFSIGSRSRLVVACVAISDALMTVDPLTGSVSRQPLAADISAAEQAAIELALTIAESWKAETLVVAAGGKDSLRPLRAVTALGARTARVPWPPRPGLPPSPGHSDPADDDLIAELACNERQLARALAAAIRSYGEPDLVLCGERSVIRGTGAVPAFLAAEFGAAQACGLVSLQVEGDVLLAERRLENGRRERLCVPRPAVCSVEAGRVRLRRATLGSVVESESVEPRTVAPVLGPDAPIRYGPAHPFRPRAHVVPAPIGDTPLQRLIALAGVAELREHPEIVGPIGAEAAADELLRYLEANGYSVDLRKPATAKPGSGGL